MKTRYWILIIAAVLLLSVGATLLLYNNEEASAVNVYSEGKLLYTLPLSQDTTVTIETDRGTNVVTVKDGKVAVTAADCPDHYCMDRGFCHNGPQIVCLPNRLVIEFINSGPLDGISS